MIVVVLISYVFYYVCELFVNLTYPQSLLFNFEWVSIEQLLSTTYQFTLTTFNDLVKATPLFAAADETVPEVIVGPAPLNIVTRILSAAFNANTDEVWHVIV